ncbi:MAG: type III pantothenate kinase [Candidatus Brocadiia bacterium]
MTANHLYLAFDIGNTTVRIAVRGTEGWEPVETIRTRPLENLPDRVGDAVSHADLAGEPDRILASSVCPTIDDMVVETCNKSGWRVPEFFGKDLPIPIQTSVREPEKVGNDRLLCALGAREMVGSPCIVIGMGTAITVDLIDHEGIFAGGAIAPGLRLSARALNEGTAALPAILIDSPAETPGKDTESAIRCGVLAFCRGGVQKLVSKFSAEFQSDLEVVLTGGDANWLECDTWDRSVRQVPLLIFRGMKVAVSE